MVDKTGSQDLEYLGSKKAVILRTSKPSNIRFHMPSSNSFDICTIWSSLICLNLQHWFIISYFLSQNLISWSSKYIFFFAIRGKRHEEVIEVVATNTNSSGNLSISKTIDYHRYDTLNKFLRITGYTSRVKANILAKDELNEIKLDNLTVAKKSKENWLIYGQTFAINKENIS